MIGPGMAADGLKKSFAIRVSFYRNAQKSDLKIELRLQRSDCLYECRLILALAYHSDTQHDGRLRRRRVNREKFWFHRVRNNPSPTVQIANLILAIPVVTNHTSRSSKNPGLKKGCNTKIRPRFGFIKLGDLTHVAVNRQNIGVPAKNGTDCTITLCTLTMYDVWLQLAQLPSNGADTPLITGAKPASLRDKNRMIEYVLAKVLRCSNRL